MQSLKKGSFWAYCGDHFTMYTNIDSLCWMRETIMLYANCIDSIGQKRHYGVHVYQPHHFTDVDPEQKQIRDFSHDV